jgi:hypothetical protein
MVLVLVPVFVWVFLSTLVLVLVSVLVIRMMRKVRKDLTVEATVNGKKRKCVLRHLQK